MSKPRMILKLLSFDHRALDKAVKDIVLIAERNGDKVRGPVPLPTKIERYAVIRSTHVDKESGEHFEMRHHHRLVSVEPSPQTIEALRRLDLPSSVAVEIGSLS